MERVIQGSRMSLACDNLEHVAVVPSGFFAPGAQAVSRALVLGDKVKGHLAKESEVARSRPVAHPAVILAEGDVQHPMQRVASRPEEFHLRPLTERCGSLSAHTAPTKQPVGIRVFGMSNGFVAAKVSSCCQLDVEDNRLAQPLCSGRITSLHRSYELVRPRAPHWYARLVVVATCTSPLASERQVPAVPHESPDQTRASSTPVAIRPVSRCPAD